MISGGETSLAVAIICSLLMVGGSVFSLLAALGILRLPDVYTRMHAASKAGTVGSGLMLLSVGLYSGDTSVFLRAFAGVIFFVLTAPIGAHLLARAAHSARYKLADVTVADEMPVEATQIAAAIVKKAQV